jgi:hypothetical protein
MFCGTNVDNILLKKVTTEMLSEEFATKVHSLCIISHH